MRLDDFDPSSIDVEDQRGDSGGFGGGFGGGFPLLPLLMLGGGRLGWGTLLLIIIGVFLFRGSPLHFASGGDVGGTLPGQQQVQGGSTTAESCTKDAGSREACKALASLNRTWAPIMQQAGVAFSRPKLVFYTQEGRSGCGEAQSAMGPFYCPSDNGIYLDTDFFRQMDQELGAGGAFARDYVIAHEFGHHIQNLIGTSNKVRRLQEDNPDAANPLSVRLELQADCYAGVWAGQNRDRMEQGDMESGLNAAHQIGDDTLMKSAGRRPAEASFTHGSSAQRMEWLKKGIESGNPAVCNTFADLR